MKTALGTGLSGLVGGAVTEGLSREYAFINFDLRLGVDILDRDSIARALDSHPGEVLLHCAGFTNVSAAHEQYGDKQGSCYQVNVDGTRHVAELCHERGIHLVHISTGYVFDGEQETPYVETDPKNPQDWYSVTKSLAEDVVTAVAPEATLLRINFPFRKVRSEKPDIWHKMADTLQAGKTGPFFHDHTFTLTPLEWFVPVVQWAFAQRRAGIFHATTSDIYSDLTLAQKVAASLGITTELSGSSVVAYNATAARPYQPHLILDNTKLVTAMHEDGYALAASSEL